jgi:hypothetical protein
VVQNLPRPPSPLLLFDAIKMNNNNNNNNNNNDNCDSFIKKCQDCYQKHYNGGGNNNNNLNIIIENPSMNNKYKKCWIPTLKVRRCQAFIKCKNEAFNYYKSPSDNNNNNHLNGGGGPKDKGICSAYDESYCTYIIISFSFFTFYDRSNVTALVDRLALHHTTPHGLRSIDSFDSFDSHSFITLVSRIHRSNFFSFLLTYFLLLVTQTNNNQSGFGNPQIMKIDLLVEINKSNNNIKIIEQRQKQRQDIFNHHEKAKRRVIASKNKQSQCNEIRSKLNNCLRKS